MRPISPIVPIQTGPTPQATPPPTDPSKPEQAATQETATPEKFVFGGYEFDSPAAAEHAFKSTDGRIRALQRQLEETRTILARVQGAPAAPQAPGAAPVAAPPAAAAPAGPGEWYENDALWDRYKKLAVEDGPDYAGYLLARQMWEQTLKLIESKFSERVGPIEASAQVAHAYQDTIGKVNELSQLADNAGNPVYPELLADNPQVLQEVVDLWTEMGGYRGGQRAWHMAILEYRFRHGPPSFAAPAPTLDGQGAPAPGGPPNPGSVAAPVAFVPRPGIFPLAGGTGTPRRDEGPSSPADALFRGLNGAVADRKTPDGFSLGMIRR